MGEGGAGAGAGTEVDAELLETVRQSGALMRQVGAQLAPAQGSAADLTPNPAALGFIQSALSGGVLSADSCEVKDLAEALVASETAKARQLTKQNAPANLAGANNLETNRNANEEGEEDRQLH